MPEQHWAPSVAVVGVGGTGGATVEAIETPTAANLLSAVRRDDLEDALAAAAASEFVFLTGDLSEPRVTGWTAELLDAAGDACSTLLFEGETDHPSPLCASLLLPVTLTAVSRTALATTLADFLEAMLPPTVENLGHGDFRAVAGSGRVGTVTRESLADPSLTTALTPRHRIPSPDAVLLYYCTGQGYSRRRVSDLAEARDRPADAAHLWDHRVHERYEGDPHVKRIRARAATDRERRALLTE